jgi:hypothetical protein
MADVTKVDIGPCSMTLGGVDVGHTEGGTKLMYSPTSVELKVDQYGDTPVDYALLGEELSVECNIAEITEANFYKSVTFSTKSTSGGNTMVGMGATAGALASSVSAGELVLHPLSRTAGDKSHDVTLYKVIVDSAIELDFAADKQKILKVVFKALIDESKPAGKRLGHYGTHIS